MNVPFSIAAAVFIIEYLRKHKRATGEAIVNAAKAEGIEPPRHDRQFGPVFFRLQQRSAIAKDGFAPRTKGHGASGAVIWKLDYA